MDEEKNDGLKSLSQNFKKRVWIVLVTFVLLALMVFVGFRALHLDFNLVNTSIMVGVFLCGLCFADGVCKRSGFGVIGTSDAVVLRSFCKMVCGRLHFRRFLWCKLCY